MALLEVTAGYQTWAENRVVVRWITVRRDEPGTPPEIVGRFEVAHVWRGQPWPSST